MAYRWDTILTVHLKQLWSRPNRSQSTSTTETGHEQETHRVILVKARFRSHGINCEFLSRSQVTTLPMSIRKTSKRFFYPAYGIPTTCILSIPDGCHHKFCLQPIFVHYIDDKHTDQYHRSRCHEYGTFLECRRASWLPVDDRQRLFCMALHTFRLMILALGTDKKCLVVSS